MAEDDYMFVPEGISQRAIAARAGVSVATVSRAVAGSVHVSRRTRQEVQRAVNDLIHEGRSIQPAIRMIGLTNSHLVQSPEATANTMLQEILGGVESAGLTAGVSVYTFHQSGALLDSADTEVLARLDGLLLAGGVVNTDVIAAVRRRGLPAVLVGGHVPDSPLSSVTGDVARGTYLLVRHLADLGHERIAFINGPVETYTSFERRAGYLEGLYDSGISLQHLRILSRNGYTGFSEAAGYELTQQLLSEQSRPTAIVFASDQQALGGLRAVRQAGLRVPEDISIVGFDNAPIARATSPRLTTVSVDRVEWGSRAFDRLLRLIDGERSFAGDRLLLPVTLKIRESTGPVRGQE